MAKDKELLNKINEIFDFTTSTERQTLERIWFRNVLYMMGEQWIYWQGTTRSFQGKRKNRFMPTPVDNIIRPSVKSLVALVLGRKYNTRVYPNSNEHIDKQAALIAEKILKNMNKDNDSQFLDEKELAVMWTILCGTGFMRTYPQKNNLEWGMEKKVIEKGEVRTENIIPFNVYPDVLGDRLYKKRYIGIKSLKPREWVEDTFHIKITEGQNQDLVSYEKRLMRIVAEVSPWKGVGLERRQIDVSEDDLVLYKEVEFRPDNKHYPEGRYVAVAGNKVVIDVKRLPIPVKDDKWYYTLTELHYNYVPGRFWSDGGVNDLIPQQDKINYINQATEINAKSLGRPYVLTSTGLTIKKVSDKNSPGLVAIEYDDKSSRDGKQPKIEKGTPLPEQIIKERNEAKIAAQDSSGDPRNILRGQSPSAQASGYLVDILRETAEQGFTPDLDRLTRAFELIDKKKLILAQIIYTEERMFKTVGAGRNIEVQMFTGADLRGHTDVHFEQSSGLSYTNAGKTQTIISLLQGGLFGDLNLDPATREEVLRAIGLAGFENKLSVDVERAEYEHSIILSGSIEGIFTADIQNDEVLSDDPLFKYDNHIVHSEVHRRFILSDEFRALPTEVQTVFMSHIDITDAMVKEQMMQQQQTGFAADTEQPPPENPNQPTDQIPVEEV